MRGPHDADSFRNLPSLVEVVLSADGRRLAAAYVTTAMNRPGTDWDAWVATWDLESGARHLLRDATRPLAWSADGEWLAAARYERTRDPRTHYQPQGLPALWPRGEPESVRMLEGDFEPNAFAAFCIPAGRPQMLGCTWDGRLVGWPLAGPGPAVEHDRIPPLEPGIQGRGWLGDLTRVRLQVVIRDLVLVASSPERAGGVGRVVEWVREGESWRRPSVHEVPGPANLNTPGLAALRPLHGSAPAQAWPLPPTLARAAAGPGVRPAAGASERVMVAFAPATLRTAWVEPGTGLAVVAQGHGREPLATFPVHQVHAFTPDGRLLITSERNGVIRFWDPEGPRIVRSLRLDDRPPETFRAAAVQAASEFGDPAANRASLTRLVRQAAQSGARVVVLPETAIPGYLTTDLRTAWQVGAREMTPGLTGADPGPVAETVPGPSTRHFAALARELGIYLTVPLLEVEARTGEHFNTLVLVGPEGSVLAHYRKLDPWWWAERGWATEGNLGRPVADTPFGRFGLLICYDIHAQAREMARLRIDALLYAIAWVDKEDSDWFGARLPARAREHGYAIVAANWTLPRGTEPPAWHGYGQSRILGADGAILARAPDDIGEAIVFAELPLPARGSRGFPREASSVGRRGDEGRGLERSQGM